MYITEDDIVIKKGDIYAEICLKEGDMPWIGGINGVFYSISRGKTVKVPVALAKLIMQNGQAKEIAKFNTKDYEKGEGKCLGGKRK